MTMFRTKNLRYTALLPLLFLSACGVPKEEHAAVVASRDSLQSVVHSLQTQIGQLNTGISSLSHDVMVRDKSLDSMRRVVAQLEQEVENTQATYANLKSNSSAEIQELIDRLDKARRDIAEREQRLQQAEQKLRTRDSTMNALRQRLTDALFGFRDNGLTIDVRNGKVYVSLSNKLLFSSGSTTIDERGKEALRELANVLQSQPDITILVEGHTDNVPVTGKGRFQDNWDLSVLRSTEVIRILTTEGKLEPQRISAAGRSEYDPKQAEDTPEARAMNRRTEIILTPKLDELLDVLKQ